MPPPPVSFPARVRLVGKVIYWLAVLAASVVLLILLVQFFEARDESNVGARAVGAAVAHT